MAETFQDRLVTELRLANARTIDQATAVLRDFLPRFNARFAVQAEHPEHPEPAYRPVAPDLRLCETLCFKDTRKVSRDNTVKYRWRILQLLPDPERPSYAGLRVDLLERPDGGTHRPVPGPHGGYSGAATTHGRAVGWGQSLVSRPRTQANCQQRGGSSHHQVPAAPPGCCGTGTHRRGRGRGSQREDRRQQGIEPVGANTDAHPVGTVEGYP